MRAIDADYILTAGQWISVKDHLPITITLDRWEDSDFVLVHSEADEYGFGYYTIFNNGTGHWTADNNIKHKIDYWLKIPEIPDGK